MPAVRKYFFPDCIVRSLEAWFQKAGRREVEDVAVCAGQPTRDGDAVIQSALHPDAERAEGWYEQRDGPSWDELYLFGHKYGMYYLLQLHTHPEGCSTRHSPRDDAGAFSDRVGFLSIVVPNFALGGLDLYDPGVSVHERVPTGWRVWPSSEAKSRFVVIPSSVDLQRDERESR